MEEDKLAEPIVNGTAKLEEKVKDIEDAIADDEMEQRKLDKIKFVALGSFLHEKKILIVFHNSVILYQQRIHEV